MGGFDAGYLRVGGPVDDGECAQPEAGGRWKLEPSSSRGPNFANAQCGAVRRRIPLGSGLQAPNTYNSRRRACQKWESSRRRRELGGLRALFCECAIQGTLPPQPTLLALTNIKYAHTVTVDKATAPILEGP